MTIKYQIRLATPDQQPIIIGLIEAAAAWLKDKKDTDQWQKPWPNEEGRARRIEEGLRAQQTWIAWDGDRPAATITICHSGQRELWGSEPSASAIYVHRLVIDRDYAGLGLGAKLLDWAGEKGWRDRRRPRIHRFDIRI